MLNQREKINHVRSLRRDLLWSFALVIIVVLFFWKTLFLGTAISKVHLIAEWDSLYSQCRSGDSYLIDPSLVLMMVPYYLFVSRIWHAGEIPLWNPDSGFGAPLLADPQSMSLSPLHVLLRFYPGMTAYNLILVGELAIAGLGAYILGRVVGLRRSAAFFSATALMLCPFEQWYLEILGNGYCLLPWLFAAFILLGRKLSISRAIVAGLAATIMILSSHPELSFCGIIMASCLTVGTASTGSFCVEAGSKVLGRALEGIKLLLLAGLVAFLTSAPMLFPFVEYLLHSQSYKFASGAPAYIPWQTVVYNMIQPGHGAASPYLGVAGFVFLIIAAFGIFRPEPGEAENPLRRMACLFALLLLVSVIFAGKMLFLDRLLSTPPCTYLVVTYFFPGIMVFLALLCGYGFERYAAILFAPVKVRAIALLSPLLLATVIVISFMPLVSLLSIDLASANFDMTLPSMSLKSRDWLISAISAALLLLLSAVLLIVRRKSPIANVSFMAASVGISIVLIMNVVSQTVVSRRSLPARPSFSYPELPITRALLSAQNSEPGGRMLATGECTLKPNTNLAYGIRDIRQHNPLFPKGYITFMQAAGARLDDFNQFFSNRISPLTALASVKSVLTEAALHTVANAPASEKNKTRVIRWTDKIYSSLVCCSIDDRTRSIQGSINWTLVKVDAPELQYLISAIDENGGVLWQSGRIPVSGGEREFAIPLDKAITEPRLAISLFDSRNIRFLEPVDSPEPVKDNMVVIMDFSKDNSNTETSPASFEKRFELSASLDNHRLYRDETALPEAYLVQELVRVSENDPLRVMQSKSFRAENQAVVEADFDLHGFSILDGYSLQKSRFKAPPHSGKGSCVDDIDVDLITISGEVPGKITGFSRPSVNRVSIEAKTESDSFLILTDTFYPGWQARVNGKLKPISKVNHVFRGVMLEPGLSSVEFIYCPLSFRGGCVTACAALLVCFLFLGKRQVMLIRRKQ